MSCITAKSHPTVLGAIYINHAKKERKKEVVEEEEGEKIGKKNLYIFSMDYYGTTIFHSSSSLFKTLVVFLFLFFFIKATDEASPPAADVQAFNLTTIPFTKIYSPLFSEFNIRKFPHDQSVHLLLNRHSGTLSLIRRIILQSYACYMYI